ncbi:oligosaccharide flippase family protein [Hymenobacter sp. PAMC 26628]|uniref:oligosaccharide flippase family protein n=1 Tax=Hymenobacter sp. PAMC 26628 TaxID=1484118 RepID=UPI00076FF0E1|nr:oligosaccharide flippase family protein [Hymenobacter sp. PAMC 26628]AMJ67847.1 hypothetical protein AXW84_22325 [Hymenobacter sp. PAMC 26628]
MNSQFKKFSDAAAVLFKHTLFKNSSWGIISQGGQTIFISLFFVIIARQYSTTIFADYLVASSMYQLVAAVSALGLGQWFIREVVQAEDKRAFINRFVKMQIYFGVGFYFVNIVLAYLFYSNPFVRILIVIFGANIVFDNIINAIKHLNVADFEQKKTFIILTLESFLKLLVASLLFVYPVSVIIFSAILVLVRFITLNLFLKYGSSQQVSLTSLWHSRIRARDVGTLLRANWPFIIIGGVSIINWRIATIIIAKTLTAVDVANYEISFKIFSIAQILPIIISTTVFPLLIKLLVAGDQQKFRDFYRQSYLYYLLFGLLAYTFVYTFVDQLMPLIFGAKYALTGGYAKQMFLTILVFPTALLQANVLIALKLEKQDMLFNTAALLVNVLFCLVGLHFVKSLYIVNYSIFASFLVFHLLQDVLLVRKQVTTLRHVLSFYGISVGAILGFIGLTKILFAPLVFALCWGLCGVWLFGYRKRGTPAPGLRFAVDGSGYEAATGRGEG